MNLFHEVTKNTTVYNAIWPLDHFKFQNLALQLLFGLPVPVTYIKQHPPAIKPPASVNLFSALTLPGSFSTIFIRSSPPHHPPTEHYSIPWVYAGLQCKTYVFPFFFYEFSSYTSNDKTNSTERLFIYSKRSFSKVYNFLRNDIFPLHRKT